MNNFTSSLFRDEALRKSEVPGNAGRMPTMFRRRFFLVFWLLAIVILIFVIWSICGRINENVYGGGVITQYQQYGSVSSPGDGILFSLDVEEGDMIVEGQLIGRIFSHDDFLELITLCRLLKYQQQQLEQFKKEIQTIKTEKTQVVDAEKKMLDMQIVRIDEQLKWYEHFIPEIQRLSETGSISKLNAMEHQETNNARLRERDNVVRQITGRKIDLADQFLELKRLTDDYELETNRTRFDAEQKMHAILFRSQIISYCSGTVSNINVDIGNAVTKGTELLRVTDHKVSDAQVWSVYAYFSAADAHKIVPGMHAVVTPTTVKAERTGSIYGVVSEVGSDLETKESLNRFYHSSHFSEFIFGRCNDVPVRVRIILSRNSANPSGFNWTSGSGPDLKVTSGTLCSACITTGRESPLNLMLAKVRHFGAGRGIMESEKGFHELSIKPEGQKK